MNKIPKVVNPVTVVGGLLGSYLMYKAFSKSKNIGKVLQIKKWINWKVKFKENTSEVEKAKAMIAVKNYILDYINASHIKITSLKLSVNSDVSNLSNEPNISSDTELIVDINGPVILPAVSAPLPHPPGPHLPDPGNISAVIANIQRQ
jgi:hypothetical protein